MKKCNKCLDIKNLTDFPKNKRQNDGYSNICKECKKCKYILHREKNIEYQKKYNQKNKEKISTYNNFYQKEYRKHNKEKISTYRKHNKEKISNYHKNWRKENKIRINEYNKQRYKNNIQYKLKNILRSRFYDILNKNNKLKDVSIIYLIGCPIEIFKLDLSSKFLPEMSWENHGEIWEIDHIKPCASFDLTDVEQQKECFHYTNLQPLFKTTEIAESFGYINQIGNRNKPKKI